MVLVEFLGGLLLMSSSNPTQETYESVQKPTTRGKTDIAWQHCRVVEGQNSKRELICQHCNKIFKGGGINRVKQHLAGIKGDVEPCKKVSADIRFQIQSNIEDYSNKKRKTQEEQEESNDYPNESLYCDDVVELHSSFGRASITKERQKEKGGKTMQAYFMPRTVPGAQPTIKSVLQSKEVREKCDIAIAKWMFATNIPFNATNSSYYQPMIDAIAGMGAGYKGPGVSSVRGYLLKKNVEEINEYVYTYRKTWKETGCTIMADGWTDQRRRTLINFLVYCPKGTVFLKSVDASDASKTSEMLFHLFKEIVTSVGPQNVVQFVTDNAANYHAAGKLLEQEFPTLYWSPCAAHCVNLMLADIGKLNEVEEVVEHAAKITKFIYNHCFALHLMRKHTNGREILRPAPTRFATNFIALKLRKRKEVKKNYDPISFESFEEICDWILEDEPPSLTVEELEVLEREFTSNATTEKDVIADCDLEFNLNDIIDDDDEEEHGGVANNDDATEEPSNMEQNRRLADTFGVPLTGETDNPEAWGY